MVEKRERRRRDGTTYFVWRARWRDERGIERSKTFDRATDARAFEAKLRTLKRSGALADLDAGTETLAEFVEEWWLVYAGPNLERFEPCIRRSPSFVGDVPRFACFEECQLGARAVTSAKNSCDR